MYSFQPFVTSTGFVGRTYCCRYIETSFSGSGMVVCVLFAFVPFIMLWVLSSRSADTIEDEEDDNILLFVH